MQWANNPLRIWCDEPQPWGSTIVATAMRLRFWCAVLIAGAMLAVAACSSGTSNGNTLRVGVLEYGSVSWELAIVQSRDLARKRDIKLKVVPYASENALQVALQGDKVDVIVSDWLWVARQRAAGRHYQFAPYSLAVGSVIVDPGSGIQSLGDLAGRKLGIAGGPVDKTWLLLRAYAEKTAGVALKADVTPKFVAPPFINKLMLRGDLPAAINYWQYNARLEAQGMQPLLTLDQMLAALDVAPVPPLLGWVFQQDWAAEHPKLLKRYLDATYAAKSILANADAPWKPIRNKVNPGSDAVFAAIKKRYRDGIPQAYGKDQIDSARKLFRILAEQGGRQLVGKADTLPSGVFWDGFRLQ